MKDYASFEKAYFRATDGLAANRGCTRSPQMHDVNNAYLLTWKTVAERYLDVPFRTDRDIANPADPFATPNDLLPQVRRLGSRRSRCKPRPIAPRSSRRTSAF